MDSSGEFAFWEAITRAAESAQANGCLEQAERHFRQAIEHSCAAFGTDHLNTAHSWFHLGKFLQQSGRLTEGEIMHQNAAHIYELRNAHLLLATTLRHLAEISHTQGFPKHAEQMRAKSALLLSENLGT